MTLTGYSSWPPVRESHELRFRRSRTAARVMRFRATPRAVSTSTASPSETRIDYLYARAVVGREVAPPAVDPAGRPHAAPLEREPCGGSTANRGRGRRHESCIPSRPAGRGPGTLHGPAGLPSGCRLRAVRPGLARRCRRRGSRRLVAARQRRLAAAGAVVARVSAIRCWWSWSTTAQRANTDVRSRAGEPARGARAARRGGCGPVAHSRRFRLGAAQPAAAARPRRQPFRRRLRRRLGARPLRRHRATAWAPPRPAPRPAPLTLAPTEVSVAAEVATSYLQLRGTQARAAFARDNLASAGADAADRAVARAGRARLVAGDVAGAQRRGADPGAAAGAAREHRADRRMRWPC